MQNKIFLSPAGAANSPSTHRQRRGGASGAARRERRANRRSAHRKRLSVTAGVALMCDEPEARALGTIASCRYCPLVSVARHHYSGFARMVERAGETAKLAFKAHPHMLHHAACGFALANKGHRQSRGSLRLLKDN